MSKNKPKIRNQVEIEPTAAFERSQERCASEFEKTLYFVREIVETFAIAFVLAFLFRTFEGELFSIPTGSMAPTLMGRHKDYYCPECGFRYTISASEEFDAAENKYTNRVVFGGTCPQCRFTAYIGPENPQGRNYPSFRGDNILVNKYTLNFRQPNRWDVTVFRYPGDPQTSYIKRVVGLENETLAIHNGNVYVQKAGESEFQIARKPAHRMRSMLQMVHCNDYLKPEHIASGFPTRWHKDDQLTTHTTGPEQANIWQNTRRVVPQTIRITHFENTPQQSPGQWLTEDNISFSSTPTEDFTWLNYRHCIPTTSDWSLYKNGQFDPIMQPIPPQLITDFTAYNSYLWRSVSDQERKSYERSTGRTDDEKQIFRREVVRDGKQEMEYACTPKVHDLGVNWVRDLAIECELTVRKPEGEVVLELIGGGMAFDCHFNIEKGTATLTIPGVPEFKQVVAETPIQGTGTWQVMFANIDDQLRLFVNSREIVFPEHKGEYTLPADRGPTVRDLTPAAIGTRNAEVRVNHLTVWRDIYYIATKDGNSSTDLAEGHINMASEESLRHT
ncbi:MAG: signal peptidase I, partial [Planctomycetaceae bacterium]|nr:signal peptidase I [Planctomycetaceae bacterium]